MTFVSPEWRFAPLSVGQADRPPSTRNPPAPLSTPLKFPVPDCTFRLLPPTMSIRPAPAMTPTLSPKALISA